MTVLRLIGAGAVDASQVCKGSPWAIPEAQVDSLDGPTLNSLRPRAADPNQKERDYQ